MASKSTKAGKKTKPPLTAKDWPDAPMGQATDPRCICWFGYVCEEHHDKTWSTTTVTALVIRAQGQIALTRIYSGWKKQTDSVGEGSR